MSVEKEIESINASLKQVGDQLKAHAENAQKEIKAHAKLSEETRASVDKLLTQQGELNARLQSAEQMVAKLETGGGHPAAPQSMGEQLVNAEAYQAFVKNPGAKFRMPVSAAITSGETSGGAAIEPTRVPGIIAPPSQRLTIRDLLSWGRTASNSIEYVRETGFTNAADVVSENPSAGKPQSNLTFELDSAPVATVAHWVHASKQVLSDAPMMQSYVDGRLRYGLKLKEEAQLLKGSGVGLNISGLVTQATAYANPGVTVTAENRIDRLRLAILQAELAEYYADGIVLHPTDWAAIELLKTSAEHQYLFANPRAMSPAALWSRPVVPSQSMDLGEFLVGSFQQGAQGWDRQDVSLIVSLEDRDNVIKNMVTLLVEERLALTVYRPEAFVTGDFDDLSGG